MSWNANLASIATQLQESARDIENAIADIQDELAESEKESYNEGYNKGYDKGYTAGEGDGFARGNKEGD